MKKRLLPKSRAKTAYGLLSEVQRLILEEPLRYNQGTYIERVGGEHGAVTIHRSPEAIPACGTVGCVAGWVCTLKYGGMFTYWETDPRAAKLLGLDFKQRSDFFDGGAVEGVKGSVEHAKNGVAYIEAFKQRYAKQLKAKRV